MPVKLTQSNVKAIVPEFASGSGASKQIFTSSTGGKTSYSQDDHYPISGNLGVNTAVAVGDPRVSTPMLGTGTFKRGHVELSGDPGANDVFTLYKNGVATSIVVTVLNGATEGEVTADVSWADKDNFTWEVTTTQEGAPYARFTLLAEID